MWKRKIYGLVIGIALAHASIAQFWGGGNGIRHFGFSDCVNCQQSSASVPFPVPSQDRKAFSDISKLIGQSISGGNATGFTHGPMAAPFVSMPAPLPAPTYIPTVGMAAPGFQANPQGWRTNQIQNVYVPNSYFGMPSDGSVFFGF